MMEEGAAYRVMPLEILVYRCIAPRNVLCSVQEPHQKELVVLLEYAFCSGNIIARESLVLGILLEYQLCIRSAASLSRLAVDIREEVDQLHSLDHVVEDGFVVACRSHLEPSGLTHGPYYDRVALQTVGEARDLTDDDVDRLVGFCHHCISKSVHSRTNNADGKIKDCSRTTPC